MRPKSVLVVENDEGLYAAYVGHSELQGVNLCRFPDVESAIAHLETLEPSAFPNVLIVDCMSPLLAA